MNEWLSTARAAAADRIAQRTPRERWMLIIVAVVAAVLSVRGIFVEPLRERIEDAAALAGRLETDLLRAGRIGPEIQNLQAEIGQVETRIETANATSLFQLLEQLADAAQIKQQLESIKPKTPSDNAQYPETRVEVQLRGTTLAQTVQFLYRIETAPLYLIVRSISIKTRRDESQLLDVTFSVSSFTRSAQSHLPLSSLRRTATS